MIKSINIWLQQYLSSDVQFLKVETPKNVPVILFKSIAKFVQPSNTELPVSADAEANVTSVIPVQPLNTVLFKSVIFEGIATVVSEVQSLKVETPKDAVVILFKSIEPNLYNFQIRNYRKLQMLQQILLLLSLNIH